MGYVTMIADIYKNLIKQLIKHAKTVQSIV